MDNLNLNILLRDIEEGIIIVNNDGFLLHINPKAQKIFRYIGILMLLKIVIKSLYLK